MFDIGFLIAIKLSGSWKKQLGEIAFQVGSGKYSGTIEYDREPKERRVWFEGFRLGAATIALQLA